MHELIVGCCVVIILMLCYVIWTMSSAADNFNAADASTVGTFYHPSNHGENFTSGDIYANTVYDPYWNGSVVGQIK